MRWVLRFIVSISFSYSSNTNHLISSLLVQLAQRTSPPDFVTKSPTASAQLTLHKSETAGPGTHGLTQRRKGRGSRFSPLRLGHRAALGDRLRGWRGMRPRVHVQVVHAAAPAGRVGGQDVGEADPG